MEEEGHMDIIIQFTRRIRPIVLSSIVPLKNRNREKSKIIFPGEMWFPHCSL